MSTAREDSRNEMRAGAGPRRGLASGDGPIEPDRGIWLDGGVLACACPECGAPMSIRLWLMVADCFRCGTSVELSDEQEKEALRLLRAHEESHRAELREAAAAISPTALRRPKPRPPAAPSAAPSSPPLRATPPPGPAPARRSTAPSAQPAGRVAASGVPRRGGAETRGPGRRDGLAAFLGRLLRDLPAWLVSLVFHAVVLLLLSMWYATSPDEPPAITLATALSLEDVEGGELVLEELPDAFDFESPGAEESASLLQQPGGANDDPLAMEVVDLPRTPRSLDRLADPQPLDPSAEPAGLAGQMFAGRDVRFRAQLVERAGGTTETEAAVARGLAFLVRHQNADGHWSLDGFNTTPDCDETCTGRGFVSSDVAGTSLALLPLLGAGQTHQEGQYREAVRKGLYWLVRKQRKDGGLDDGGQMYAHGQAAIVLCEAYAMTRDAELRPKAQLALDFIVQGQHSAGGWRYTPGQAGDTSVVGWQIMALKSGQMAYLRVPRKAFEGATRFLNQVQSDNYGATYSYQPRGRPTPAMSAEALLCRQYIGWPKSHAGLKTGVEYLLEHLPDAYQPNIYYWYYATQVMHHFGGPSWQQWNARVSSTLVNTQEILGHAAGSWAPRGDSNDGGYASRGGRIYMTSLALCTLEVYYRHMPIYRDSAVGTAP